MNNLSAHSQLITYLKKENHRVTPERFLVLDAALEFLGHFSADELYLEMKNKKSRISRATVYNSIDVLVRADLLHIHHFGENVKRYELIERGTNHDHLVCQESGEIIEFSDRRLKGIAEEIAKSYNFNLLNYSFIIYGKKKD